MEAGGGVQVISREVIKPSSETPPHLKRHKLSYLDQLMMPTYTPLLFFYQADQSKGVLTTSINLHAQISQRLRHSLSQTLTSFFPLAGRIQDKFVIDCNDEGVVFVEARVHGVQLTDVVEDPLESLDQYLPVLDNIAGALFLAQVTFFDCGGFTVGMRISHQLADGKSIMAFITAWAATSRGGEDCHVESPSTFDLADYFPARDLPDLGGEVVKDILALTEKTRTKMFTFDKEKVAPLKRAATSPPESSTIVKDPTRVELITAFIWEHFMHASKSKHNNPHDCREARKRFAALHAVNIRSRKKPPQLLENVFGNGIMAATTYSSYEGNDEFHELVSRLRSSIRSRIDDDYVTEAQKGDSQLNDIGEMMSLVVRGELEWITFSSWTRGFPLYEVDYGWGNPVWFTMTRSPVKNFIGLTSSSSGNAIEATVTMDEEIMQVLETQFNKLI